MQFTVIIPWKSGDPIREECLKNLLNCLKAQEPVDKLNDPIVFELIIVEQSSRDTTYASKKRIKELVPQELAEFKYIQLLHDSIAFNKSWCINVAAKEAYHDHLIIIDADSLFGKDYFSIIQDYVENVNIGLNRIMFCWDKLICLPGKDNPIVRYVRPQVTCALGGIWYVNKKYFLENLGGMNENYADYGGEDNDLYQRAILLQKSDIYIIPYTLVHQYHDWAKPSETADYLFNISIQNAHIITERLKSTNIGNKDHPTLIDMSDLPYTKL